MPYCRALALLFALATCSLGCTLSRNVIGQPPGTDTGIADVGTADGGDAGDANVRLDAGDANVDAFLPDSGMDAFVPDAFVPDSGLDAFVADTGTDAFTPDAFTPDAFVPECSAGQTRCLSAGVLQSCTAGLTWGGDTTCSLGCVGTAPAHCGVFQPSNVGPTGTTAAALTISATTVINTTTCTSAGITGLAIEPQLAGGRNACVLRVANLTVTSTGILYAGGDLPFVVVSTSDVTIDGIVDVSSYQSDPTFGTFVRGAGSNTGGTIGGDGGPPSGSFADGGGGGGGFCGAGGAGGDGTGGGGGPGTGGASIGATTLEPLVGGADGGDGGTNPDSNGPGGGALQISSFTRILIGPTAVFGAAGGGGDAGIDDGNDTSAGGGGGSGGALLLEAPTVTVAAGARFNAGGGGGASGGCVGVSDGRDGADASESFLAGMLRAPGGTHICGPAASAGAGAGGTEPNGGTGSGGVTNASGGGGGGGCIVFRTETGTTPSGVVTSPTTVVSASAVHSL